MLPLTRSQQARLCWLLDTATDTELAALPLVLRDWVFALRQRVHALEGKSAPIGMPADTLLDRREISIDLRRRRITP